VTAGIGVELLLRCCPLLWRYFAIDVGFVRCWRWFFWVPLCTSTCGQVWFAEVFLARIRHSGIETIIIVDVWKPSNSGCGAWR